MKFGVCTGVQKERIPIARMCLDVGFDFIEANAGMVFQMTDEEIDEVVSLNLPILSANGMFPLCYPGTKEPIRIIGPEKKTEWCEYYVKEVMRKCGKLGIKTIVFGSGRQRYIPDGMSKQEGLRQYRNFCVQLADEGKKYGITIAVEPLSYEQTNSINTMIEGFEQVKLINHPNVKFMTDIYHMHQNNEPLEFPQDILSQLVHIHWRDPVTKLMPESITDEQLAFAEFIKKMKYDGMISIESPLPENMDHVKSAIKTLKEMFK